MLVDLTQEESFNADFAYMGRIITLMHTLPTGVPASSLLLTVGRVPFVGFLYAQEGSAPPFVADVALLYASKLKDALVSAARYVIIDYMVCNSL